MMRTITFDAKIQDGKIKVPEMYNTAYTGNIKVIMILENFTEPGTKTKPQRFEGHAHDSQRARGILSGFKNSRLIRKEKSAWALAVKEKYENC